MTIQINKINTNYLDNGSGQNIIILPGWGSSINVMKKMFDHLSENNRVIILDLPGFGETDALKNSWSLNDYVLFVIEFMNKLNIKTPIIIGHSFGGRIAIKLASEYHDLKIDRVILIDSAGIKKVIKSSLKSNILKISKKTFSKVAPKLVEKAKNKIGSADYRNASPIMKATLVNVVNEDLTANLSEIKASTLLIWGENDLETPISNAEIMRAHIPDAGIVLVPNAGHFSFLDNPNLVHAAINSFISNGGK